MHRKQVKLFCFCSTFRRAAGLDMDGHFLFNVIYEDEITFNVVGAAVKVLGMIKSSPLNSTFYQYICHASLQL